MELRKVLIADGTEEFRSVLEEALQGAYQIRCCGDGVQALEAVGSFEPDLVVLDLMLPGMDGISLLRAMESMEICPKVLATTRFSSDYVMDAVSRLGVSYVMTKPCDIRATVERIGDLLMPLHKVEISEPEPRTVITNMLLTLNVPTKLRGYPCLREAILLMAQRPGISITKELYPTVGAPFGFSGIQVERLIRTAIESGWKVRDENIWRQYFSPGQEELRARPSNAVFISRMANELILRRHRAGA